MEDGRVSLVIKQTFRFLFAKAFSGLSQTNVDTVGDNGDSNGGLYIFEPPTNPRPSAEIA